MIRAVRAGLLRIVDVALRVRGENRVKRKLAQWYLRWKTRNADDLAE